MPFNLRVALFLLLSTSAVLGQIGDVVDDTNGNEHYATQPTTCKSVRGLEGECVPFDRCIYGSDHIDMRMYRPTTYTNTCASALLCCPKNYVHHPLPPQIETMDEAREV